MVQSEWRWLSLYRKYKASVNTKKVRFLQLFFMRGMVSHLMCLKCVY